MAQVGYVVRLKRVVGGRGVEWDGKYLAIQIWLLKTAIEWWSFIRAIQYWEHLPHRCVTTVNLIWNEPNYLFTPKSLETMIGTSVVGSVGICMNMSPPLIPPSTATAELVKSARIQFTTVQTVDWVLNYLRVDDEHGYNEVTTAKGTQLYRQN